MQCIILLSLAAFIVRPQAEAQIGAVTADNTAYFII
jgi:hypothetical protein